MNQLPKHNTQFIRIDRGINQFNHDYYAALGLPIISSPVYIRHVYLSIARVLHPDIYGFASGEKEIATQYLAKLVNPAYNILMKEQEREAYQGIFKLLAKRLMQKSRNVPIHSAIACELMFSPSDGLYERSVSAIAEKQYQSITNILEYTAQISELNLVYILYKEGYIYGAPNMPPVLMPMFKSQASNFFAPVYPTTLTNTKNNQYANPVVTVNGIQPQIDLRNAKTIADRLKICEVYISQSDWKAALKELRDILQIDKDNSKCLAMLGVVYININQPQMAKISLQRSLQLNPQESLAIKHLNNLNNPNFKSDSKPKPATPKKVIPPPQKRGWLSNLLGWSDNSKG